MSKTKTKPKAKQQAGQRWELTDVARAQIPAWNARWVDVIRSCEPVDFVRTRDAVLGMYRAAELDAGDLRVVRVLSPMMAVIVGSCAAVYWRVRGVTAVGPQGWTSDSTEGVTRHATVNAVKVATDTTHFMTSQAVVSRAREATSLATNDAIYAAVDATNAATDAATYRVTGNATAAGTDEQNEVVTYLETTDTTDDITHNAVQGATAEAIYDATSNATNNATTPELSPAAAILAATREATADATEAATGNATLVTTTDATEAATGKATALATFGVTFAASSNATDEATGFATHAATRDATVAATAAATEAATYDATAAATAVATRDAVLAAIKAATFEAANTATGDAATDSAADVAIFASMDVAISLATRPAAADATDDAVAAAIATAEATTGATAQATLDATLIATGSATWESTRPTTHVVLYDMSELAIRNATDSTAPIATVDAIDAAIASATAAATYAAVEAATAAATADETYAATVGATYGATRAETNAATADVAYAAINAATTAATAKTASIATDAAAENFNYGTVPFYTEMAVRFATRITTYAATDDAIDDIPRATTTDIAAIMFQAAASVVNRKLGRDVTEQCRQQLQMWSSFYNGGSEWAAWCCYLSFVRDVIGWSHPSHENYKFYEDAAVHGGPRFMHAKFVLLSERAAVRHIDDNGRLHCENGPAIKWHCGTERYYIHGVLVDKQIVVEPHTQTLEQIASEENAEVRRIRIERYGWQKYLSESDATVLEYRRNHVDGCLEALMEDRLGNRVLVGACPSTGRIYTMPVPSGDRDGVGTCELAQTWLHGGRDSRKCLGAS